MSADDDITRQKRPAGASEGDGLALFTDLYQLTMLQAYFEERMTERAVFSLFVRRLPPRRNFLIACGLNAVLDYLENLRFTQQDLAYLDSLEIFSDRFLTWLADFRFTGDVHAVREGTPIFANEPILEVEAPLPEAQLIETFVMNQVQLQAMLASKAHRVVTAARGRSVIDFGARRMHGTDAALNAARAFWIAGVNATSNVLAGKRFGIPVAGTLAHSYIQAHGDEAAAFRAFANLYPDTVLLVDTYDTLAGVQKVIELAKRLGEYFKVRAVRLDSGDLLDLSLQARAALDQAGLHNIQIIASGSLDEYEIDALVLFRCSSRRIRRWHRHGSLSRRSLPRYRLQAHVLRGRRTGQAVGQQTRPPRSQAGVSQLRERTRNRRHHRTSGRGPAGSPAA